MTQKLTLTYIGGPTALLELAGVRLLTDPTFDPAGGEYPSGPAILRKLTGPALSAAEVGPVDAVLLSHDHHFDNLDRAGKEFLRNAKEVLTTDDGRKRLGGNSVGLKPWKSADVSGRNGSTLRVVATPARHGPKGMDRGAVAGFVASPKKSRDQAIYFSGDTVWYEELEEVAKRFAPRVALLNLGAARVPEVGPFHLTMTANEAVQAAKVFSQATIVPLHFEGWAHFSEGRNEIHLAFSAAGVANRLRWPEAGQAIEIAL